MKITYNIAKAIQQLIIAACPEAKNVHRRCCVIGNSPPRVFYIKKANRKYHVVKYGNDWIAAQFQAAVDAYNETQRQYLQTEEEFLQEYTVLADD